MPTIKFINYTAEREYDDGAKCSILLVDVDGEELMITAIPPESEEEMQRKINEVANEI